MPHYYFDLTDGITRRDRRGLDCSDEAEAIVKATTIATEVEAWDSHGCNLQLNSTPLLALDYSQDCHVIGALQEQRGVILTGRGPDNSVEQARRFIPVGGPHGTQQVFRREVVGTDILLRR